MCKIEPNSLPKESRYLKIPRNKLIFSGFNCHFGFYPLKFCSRGNLRDRYSKFFLFGIFDLNQVAKRGPQKIVTEPKKCSSTINDKYENRPDNLHSTYLADFASHYVSKKADDLPMEPDEIKSYAVPVSKILMLCLIWI